MLRIPSTSSLAAVAAIVAAPFPPHGVLRFYSFFSRPPPLTSLSALLSRSPLVVSSHLPYSLSFALSPDSDPECGFVFLGFGFDCGCNSCIAAVLILFERRNCKEWLPDNLSVVEFLWRSLGWLGYRFFVRQTSRDGFPRVEFFKLSKEVDRVRMCWDRDV